MSTNERTYTVRNLILVAVLAVIFTVLGLELAGRIKHDNNKDNMPVGDFKAIHVEPGETFTMSPKSSELHAVCEQGYLAIAADADPDFRGILVDYKNRGVRCARPDHSGEPAGDE